MKKDINLNRIDIQEEIPRYSFNGKSSYLIDKFYIFGYDSTTINKYLYNDENLKNIIKIQNDEGKFQKFQLKEPPSILNEFASDYEKQCFELDMLRDMIFPNKVNLYYSEEEKSYSRSPEKRRKKEISSNKNSELNAKKNDDFYLYEEGGSTKKDIPPSYNVVFSSNPQSGNNSKKSINGIAYIFYKKLKKSKKDTNRNINISFYVPTIFSIISEYPFYNSFYQLCMQIECLFTRNELRIPIEIIIYNLIKLSPSPLNGDVSISLNSFVELEKESSKHLNYVIAESLEEGNEDYENSNNEKIENKSKNIHISCKNLSKNAIKRNSDIKSLNRLNLYGTSHVLKHLKTISTSKSNKDFTTIDKKITDNNNIFNRIKFDYLSGYPIIQYNLAKVLLQTLTPIDIIDIFLYTFLEKDIIFFSKDLEFLSLTINSYLNLNFPLNDEKYYFVNACVSYDIYKKGESTFVGSAFTSIIGINDTYNPKYQVECIDKIKEHLAVDLDNGKIYKVDDKSDKEKNRKNKELFNYIKYIYKNRESKNDINILYREISILSKLLYDIDSKKNKEDDLYYLIFKNKKYIDYEENIKNINIKIQDSFYRFINNISLYIYQNLLVRVPDDYVKMKGNKRNNENKEEFNVLFLDNDKEDYTYSNEEIYLLEELRDTMKFQSFVYSFVQSYNPIDLYKIPLTFTEEFISIIYRKNSILEGNINFFSLIDNLYKNKSEGEIIINFESIVHEYYLNYKNYFDREIQDIYEDNKLFPDKIKIKNYNIDNRIITKYKSYELDDRVLKIYLNLLNSIEYEENENINENEFFNLRKKIQENVPKKILVTEIESIIENYAIEQGILSENDICSANIIILFSICLRSFISNEECSTFIAIIFQLFTIFRKYYSMILSIVYSICKECLANKDDLTVSSCLNLYYICINSLRNVKLIPNESLMNIIKSFNKIAYDNLSVKKYATPIKKEINENKTGVKLYGFDYPKDEITSKNLYVTHNFSFSRFYREEEIIEIKNNSNNSNKGNYETKEYNTLKPKIKFNNGIDSFNSDFYSQKKLLLSLIQKYKEFMIDMNEKNIEYKELVDACLNILIFMRNSKEFKTENDLFKMAKEIFYIILNRFLLYDPKKKK